MKRLLAILLAVMILLTLVACGGEPQNTPVNPDNQNNQNNQNNMNNTSNRNK